jgi:UDP-N-acetylglucosamine 4,6-dehydratase
VEFTNKTVLITGGTGSFGRSFLSQVLKTDVREIRIFSRDELKQEELRRTVKDERVRFFIGDIRDRDSIRESIRNVDFLFHAAALKQVPSCEFFPIEAVKTNVLGSQNVIDLALEAEVRKVVVLSTDKAVYPINAMGLSKAMMEKVAISKSRQIRSAATEICVTRYGNVLASRGSVVPLFLKQLAKKEAITVTDPNMTRFIMSLDEAINLVFFALENGTNGQIFVKKSPATTIQILAEACSKYLNAVDAEILTIGQRHGEKKHEYLLSAEEYLRVTDMKDYFCVQPDERDLNYDLYTSLGHTEADFSDGYSSKNTVQLGLVGTIDLLNSNPECQEMRRHLLK